MFDGVWSDDPLTQLETATLIKKLLANETVPYPTASLVRAGVVPRLVYFLRREEFPTIQYEAAWSLTNIAADNPGVVVVEGAVSELVKLLGSPKDYVREQAIWALGNVSGDSKHRDHVLECGALKPLLVILLYPDTHLPTLRIGTWALMNLCRGTPSLAFDEVKPALEILLHSNDELVLKNACLALWYLSHGAENGIQSMIDAGFVPRLVEILQHPSPAVLVTVLRTIGTIVSGDHQQTQCVINCGALPMLSNVLTRNYENNKIKKVAFWTISNITAGTGEQIQSVIDANLIPTLVYVAQSAEFDMKKESVWAILNATLGASHDQIKYMVEQSCIKPLCDILLCPDVRVILKCLDALENILKAGEAQKKAGDVNCYSQLIEDAVGLEKIENLQHHESNEIYEKALKILETYWLREDDEETQQPPR